MTEAAGSPPPPRAVAAVLANLVAALAVGAAFASLAFIAGAQVPPPYAATANLRLPDLAPALLVIVAAGVAVSPWLRRWGWLVAAVGIAGAIGLFLQGTVLERDLLYGALAVVVGLQLGGVLLALGAACAASRWAILVGLPLGLTAGRAGLVLVVDRLHATVLSGPGRADEVALGVLALVTAAVGVLHGAWRPPRSRPSPSGAGDWRGPAVAIVLAAVVGRGLLTIWQFVLGEVAQSSTGGISQPQAHVVETLDRVSRIVIAAVIAVILGVVAYRRGGPGLARWVVVGFALAAVPFDNVVFLVSVASSPSDLMVRVMVQLILPALAGALLAGLAVRTADFRLPWDALSVALAAVGVWTGSMRSRLIGLVGLAEPLTALGAFAVAFALTAGLARLAPGPSDPAGRSSGRRGLTADEVPISAALGFAALFLCQQVYPPVNEPTVIDVTSAGPPLRLDPLVPVLAGALVLAVLFVLDRRAARPSAGDAADAIEPRVPGALPAQRDAGAGSSAGAEAFGG